MISAEIAKKIVFENTQASKPDSLSLREALSHVLSENIYSIYDIPNFNQSSVDGFAFNFEDWSKGITQKICGESQAGNPNHLNLKSGQARRIFTGAPVPEGADTVIMQEFVKTTDGYLVFEDPEIHRGKNFRLKGSEIKKGILALPLGTYLNAARIGFLASIGISKVPVFLKPKISLIITGNELQKPDQPLKPAKVFESNSFALEAALLELNFTMLDKVQVKDQLKDLKDAIYKQSQISDLLIITGGVSVGEYDFTVEALQQLGFTCLFHKVNQRPGKPLYFGKKDNLLVFGLPGNPASVLSCFYQYIIPCLEEITQQKNIIHKIKVKLEKDYSKILPMTFFLKGLYQNEKLSFLNGQESYKLGAFSEANCFIELEEGKANFLKGEMVPVYLLP
jgi:molybdopterin molybdotransferase